jgi:hypothetical protein
MGAAGAAESVGSISVAKTIRRRIRQFVTKILSKCHIPLILAAWHGCILLHREPDNREQTDRPCRIPVAHDDISTNDSTNDDFSTTLEVRLSRSLLRGTAASAATAMPGAIGLSACGGSGSGSGTTAPPPAMTMPPPADRLLGFTAVSKSLLDAVVVPSGYTASVLYAMGKPLTATTPAFRNDGTDLDHENRAGDQHDGPASARARPRSSSPRMTEDASAPEAC